MIIVEGIDGVGKSTVSAALEGIGYEVHHLRYDEKNEKGFMSLLKSDKGNLVLDRGFITEVVYGPVLRKYSRINDEALRRLVSEYGNSKTKIIYLTALKEDLLKRRRKDIEDYKMLLEYYDELNRKYEEKMSVIDLSIPILRINTSYNDIEETQNKVRKFIRS